MRISDWSSDVCSSDLIERGGDHRHQQAGPEGAAKARHFERIDGADTANVRDHAARSSPFGSRTNPTKISSSELCFVCRSLNWMPISLIRRSSEGTPVASRSEEHRSELQSLMRTSYAVF